MCVTERKTLARRWGMGYPPLSSGAKLGGVNDLLNVCVCPGAVSVIGVPRGLYVFVFLLLGFRLMAFDLLRANLHIVLRVPIPCNFLPYTKDKNGFMSIKFIQ